MPDEANDRDDLEVDSSYYKRNRRNDKNSFLSQSVGRYPTCLGQVGACVLNRRLSQLLTQFSAYFSWNSKCANRDFFCTLRNKTNGCWFEIFYLLYHREDFFCRSREIFAWFNREFFFHFISFFYVRLVRIKKVRK